MSRIIKLCLAVSAVIIGSLIALAADQPVIGVVSLIEIGARPGAANEGPGRGVLPNGENVRTGDEHAFVEVIHVPRLNSFLACKKSGATNCNTAAYAHEWSVPYITELNSEKVEEALSRAWNRFDSRTVWQLRAYMNSYPDPEVEDYSFKNDCGPSDIEDTFIDAWNSNATGRISTDEFCDDIESQVPGVKDRNLKPDTTKAYECKDDGKYIKSINWGVYQKRYDDVIKHSDQKYYRDYWLDVYKAIDKWMPQALDWDGVREVSGPVGTAGGSIISPVHSPQPNTAQYVELANRAQSIDPRGFNYIMQQYKGQQASKANLKKSQGDQIEPGYPGLAKIERLKYDLSDPNRDIFYKIPARKWSSIAQARPFGSKGLGSLEEQQNVGHATFLRVWARNDLEYSPRDVNVYVKCKKETKEYVISRIDRQGTNIMGNVNLKPGCCKPVTFTKTRVHSDWQSIPEGYQIPYVRNIPSNRSK
jgi:hypothetical protein